MERKMKKRKRVVLNHLFQKEDGKLEKKRFKLKSFKHNNLKEN